MSDFDPMEPFMEASSEFEARTVIAVLEDAGIEANIFVLGNLGLPHALTPGAKGVPVYVRRSQRALAERALAESRQIGASVDWESVDFGDAPSPPMPRRAPRLWTIIGRSAVVAVAAGAVASLVAWAMGASSVAATEAIATVIVLCFILMIASLGVRELLDRVGEEAEDPASVEHRDRATDARLDSEER